MAAPTLLIPTRNRPTSLRGVLDFLTTFYPGAKVIIADGSESDHLPGNRAAVEATRTALDVDHRVYPADLNFYDRMLDVLAAETDEHFVMGSDDDFPMMDLFASLQPFMAANPDYVAAMGATVRLHLTAPDQMTAHLKAVRPIENEGGRQRGMAYGDWPFATTYALTRRDVLIERCERAKTQFLCNFYDQMVGLTECIRGKVKIAPEIGFFGTWNYQHSYLRPEGGMIFLRRAELMLTLGEQIKRDLMTFGQTPEPQAEGYTNRLMAALIRQQVDAAPEKRAGFYESAAYTHPEVQAQMRMFEQLFEPANPVRERYADRLRFITDTVRRVAASGDNEGERKRYETIEAQLSGRTGAPAA